MTKFRKSKGHCLLNRCVAASLLCAVAVVCQAQSQPPKLSALAAIVMDAESGRVLYSKNVDLKLHPASTTKIMTGMLLAEKCRPEEIVTAPTDINKVKESSMHLMAGEQVSAEEMLYALMLRSANDGCHAVAVHISGSEAEFAKLMNERAQALGCTNTNFVNPHGLTDPKHLTTARDLALMARSAMKDPLFAKVVATQKHTLQRSLNMKDTLLVNRDKWLALDPRARGVKTGWTKPAGHCFVGCATDKGVTFVTAILKSDKWLEDQQAITTWAFDNFERGVLVAKGAQVGALKVKDGEQSEVNLVAAEDVWGLIPRHGAIGHVMTWDTEPFEAPVTVGQVLRKGTISLADNTKLSVDLLAEASVKKVTILSRMASPASLIGFGVLAASAAFMRFRARRWSKEVHIR